ncbi:MAG: ribonuclease P protein component [Clostridia bacterium]|nr:ribonuclease P protein component [Clostridia bacterium]
MSRCDSLKLNTEFHRVYARGKSISSPGVVTYALKSRVRGSGCRVGITTSKKIGNAVERNRCRRIIRAAFYQLSDDVGGDWDLVLVARHKTKFLKAPDIEKALRNHFETLGVIKKPE